MSGLDFDVGLLTGGGGLRSVRLPDPVAELTRTMTLGDLARRSRVSDLEEQELTRKLGEDKAYKAALPGLIQKGFSSDAVAEIARTNPDAAAKALSESMRVQKDNLELAGKRSEILKRGSDMAKDQVEMRAKNLAIVGGLAQHVVSKGANADPREYDTLARLAGDLGQDPAQYGDRAADPQGWAARLAAASIDAAKQRELAESARKNVATETQTAARDAESGRHNRTAEGLQASGQRQQMTIAEMQDARARDLADATRDNTKGAKVNAETQALGKMLESGALPALATSARALNAEMAKYKNQNDMPGVGPIDSRIPVLFQSEAGKAMRGKIQAVANDLLKMYSGGAVTANEGERRAVEMMASGNFTEADMREAWPLIVGRINSSVANARASFSPESIATYEQRGGLRLEPISMDDAAVSPTAPRSSNMPRSMPGGGGGGTRLATPAPAKISGPLRAAPQGSGVDFVYTPGGK